MARSQHQCNLKMTSRVLLTSLMVLMGFLNFNLSGQIDLSFACEAVNTLVCGKCMMRHVSECQTQQMGEQDRKRSGGERGGQGGGGVSKKVTDRVLCKIIYSMIHVSLSLQAKYWGASGGSSGSPAIPTKSGLTGVLITCDTHFEQKACREAMALIEEVRGMYIPVWTSWE